ncbi:MAG: cation transporter [Candidatus Rokubacteria bacterium]|nr:cation transporter [Candidatus Rokubacteria bacterium]
MGVFHRHRHEPAGAPESSARGIWALKVSLAGLLATALLQAAVVALSGSVALLADTLHNLADALTSLPLWIAFRLSRKGRTARFSYGYHRAEDGAGLAILLVILASAVWAGYEVISRFLAPITPSHIPLAMAAAVVGALGNEAVARIRLGVGREIGSAALVADGQHARIDALTSLAAFAGLAGVALGFPLADPLAGLIITVAIVAILWDVSRDVLARFMDAIDPELLATLAGLVRRVAGVRDVYDLRARWLGHRLVAEMTISVEQSLSLVEGHQIAEEVRHALLHEIPHLADVTIHVDPFEDIPGRYHAITAHHYPPRPDHDHAHPHGH